MAIRDSPPGRAQWAFASRQRPRAVRANGGSHRRLRRHMIVTMATKVKRKAAAADAGDDEVKFTNLDRVVFPASGYTKGDVLEYYAAVADFLLPHLRDRPVTLERLPEGVTDKGPRFWQKNTPSYYPSFIPRVNFPTIDTGK